MASLLLVISLRYSTDVFSILRSIRFRSLMHARARPYRACAARRNGWNGANAAVDSIMHRKSPVSLQDVSTALTRSLALMMYDLWSTNYRTSCSSQKR